MNKKAETKPKTKATSEGASKDSGKFEDMRDSAHKVWLAGLGVLATAEREGSKVFHKFVEAGEQLEGRGRDRIKHAREEAGQRFDRISEKIGGTAESQMAKTLERLGVPSRDEIHDLAKKIERLTAKVDALATERAKRPSPRPTTAK
ncbi:MAG TPA: phasin family protein [Thermoanaerobaculia bacterium]|nr:phasin family protein [Thermoanaerobaculia bacterium]